MSVIVMGDQGVGKTTLMLELAKSNRGNVQVISPNREDLERQFTLGTRVKPTDSISKIPMQLRVNLSGHIKQIDVDWIDTPGEVWRVENSQWRENHPQEWHDILKSIHNAEFLMIVMAPYRECLKDDLLAADGLSKKDVRFRKRSQWKNRFREWMNFLEDNAQTYQYILICLNMADLFCNTNHISAALQQQESINWIEHRTNILPIFGFVKDLIEQFEENRILKNQFFITTYKTRFLLELPWLYIGS